MTKSLNRINFLTKALLKNTTADNDPFKFRALKIAIMIIGSAIMIGCGILVGYFTKILTDAVIILEGDGTEAAQLIMYFISVFGGVFGINVICGWLFFSSDLSRLLPYPFKPNEICMSKFIVGYMQESVMEFLVVIGILVGYMISSGLSIIGVISGIIGVILLPILPLFYCALFSMIFMSLAKRVHSFKSVNMVSAMCGLVFVAIFVISLLQLEDITAEGFIYSLADGTNAFMDIMKYVFFTVPILCYAISQQSILLLLLFVVVHIVMMLVLYAVSSVLYMNGVTAVLSAGKRMAKADKKSSRTYSFFTACLLRDIKTLLRTPTYIVNCIIPTLILPIGGMIILFTGSDSVKALVNEQKCPDVLVFFAIVILSCLLTAMSGLSASSFTREGNHADLLKYIPVPYKTQINAKVITSLIFTVPTTVIGVILCCVAINSGLWLTLACVIGSVLAVVATVYLGILFDSMHPKLVWDDELSALRGNMSTFFHMAVAIGVGVVFALLYFFLAEFMLIPVVIAVLAAATVVIAIFCSKKSVQLLEEMTV
ncbi:MAG: hypothetical protein UE295_02980 [Acutalibacteraceae bacterium]|nr:hypothetical protein [Acutalibacteraceae bacterium]